MFFGWPFRRNRDARNAQNKRHLPPPMSFIPRLEPLEDRVLLSAADSLPIAANALVGDMEQVRSDVATAPYILLNAVQQPSTAQAPLAAVATQWNQIESELAADLSRTWQALVHFEIAALQIYQQEFDTLLSNLFGYPMGQVRGQDTQTSPSIDVTKTNSLSPPTLTPQVVQSQQQPGQYSVYVLDMMNGETIPANVTLNTFSTWSENLLAQVSGGPVSSYSWNVSRAPDLTNVSGTTTANLQGTWSNFGGTAHTDTISVAVTPQGGLPITQTMTFVVAGTNSPAFSSSRPTSIGTWPTVMTPDQLDSGQATQSAGPYATIGLADGSVQTSFAMPSYNSGGAPPSMGDSPT